MEHVDENKGIVSGGFESGPIGERGVAGPGRAPAVLRGLAAIVLSGLTAGVAFLIFVEWTQRRGWTEVRFNHSLGVLIGGEGTQARTDAALGVTGDTAAPTGLFWFALICIAVMALYALTVPRLLAGRHWTLQALPPAGVVYLALGLVYFPLVGSDRVADVSAGVFGTGAGTLAPLWYLLGALVFALIATRVYSLASAAAWWVEKEVDQAAALNQIEGMAGLDPTAPAPVGRVAAADGDPPSGA